MNELNEHEKPLGKFVLTIHHLGEKLKGPKFEFICIKRDLSDFEINLVSKIYSVIQKEFYNIKLEEWFCLSFEYEIIDFFAVYQIKDLLKVNKNENL